MSTTFWELTNEQRRCFGINPVETSWQRISLPRSKYDTYDTCIYVDGTHVKYIVLHGEHDHAEHALDENLSDDRQFIIPKRSTKPIKLSAATIAKRSPVGMALSYHRYHLDSNGDVSMFNANASLDYYRSWIAGEEIGDMADFQHWVTHWCAQTTPAAQADIDAFAARTMKTVHFREGDVFRFRWYRLYWGYGRILLDYSLMRKQKLPFWDCLMGKPVAIQLFQIITTDPNLPLETVLAQKTIPSENIMDNVLHYGEYEIIGNAPLPENRDELCPIMYGHTLDVRESRTLYQQGRIFREIPGKQRIGTQDYSNNAVGFTPHVSMEEMHTIIQQGEHFYWEKDYFDRKQDLRNPTNAQDLAAIHQQMSL